MSKTFYMRPTNIARTLRSLKGKTILNVKQNGRRKTGGEIAITVEV